MYAQVPTAPHDVPALSPLSSPRELMMDIADETNSSPQTLPWQANRRCLVGRKWWTVLGVLGMIATVVAYLYNKKDVQQVDSNIADKPIANSIVALRLRSVYAACYYGKVWRYGADCPAGKCTNPRGTGACMNVKVGSLSQRCEGVGTKCKAHFRVGMSGRRGAASGRAREASHHCRTFGAKSRGVISAYGTSHRRFPMCGKVWERIKPGCSGAAIEKETGAAFGACLAVASVSLALPVVGGLVSLGSALNNDCSNCKGSKSCANAIGKMAGKKAGLKLVTKALGAVPVLGAAVTFGECVIKALVDAFGSCMSASTQLRVSGGNGLKLSNLKRGQIVTMYTPKGIDASTNIVTAGGVHQGQVLGYSFRAKESKATFVHVTTEAGRSIKVTEKHFLWVEKDSKLVEAKTVKVGDALPFVGTDGNLGWDKIHKVSKIEEFGRYDPLILGSDQNTGDMVVTEAGLVVPIYAGGKEFPGIGPHGAHEIFVGWMKAVAGLEKEFPCLFEETPTGLRIVTLIDTFVNLADTMKASGGHATADEMNPQKFFEDLKKEAPRSISLQTAIGECPDFAKHLGLEDLPDVKYEEKINDFGDKASECSDNPDAYMKRHGKTCGSWTWMYENRCNADKATNKYRSTWIHNKYCQQSCFDNGNGYDGDDCTVKEPAFSFSTEKVESSQMTECTAPLKSSGCVEHGGDCTMAFVPSLSLCVECIRGTSTKITEDNVATLNPPATMCNSKEDASDD